MFWLMLTQTMCMILLTRWRKEQFHQSLRSRTSRIKEKDTTWRTPLPALRGQRRAGRGALGHPWTGLRPCSEALREGKGGVCAAQCVVDPPLPADTSCLTCAELWSLEGPACALRALQDTGQLEQPFLLPLTPAPCK